MGNTEARNREVINAFDKWGDTKLTNAARDGNYKKCENLIKKGADINLGNTTWKFTPLHLASIFGHYQIVELLVTENADVNKHDIEGLTALHRAAMKGHIEVVRYLCENGKGVNTADDNGKTPLYYADNESHNEVVKILYEFGADAQVSDENGHSNSTLKRPYEDRALEMEEKLLSKGSDPKLCLPEAKSLLSIVSDGGFSDIVKILRKHPFNMGLLQKII